MTTNLSNIRFGFLDAQNKADFFNAGKKIISEFRYLQMEEKMENQNEVDFMRVLLFKDRIIFFWYLNGKPNVFLIIRIS